MIIVMTFGAITIIGTLTYLPGWLRRRRGSGNERLADGRGSMGKVQGDRIEAARDFIDYRGKDHIP